MNSSAHSIATGDGRCKGGGRGEALTAAVLSYKVSMPGECACDREWAAGPVIKERPAPLGRNLGGFETSTP